MVGVALLTKDEADAGFTRSASSAPSSRRKHKTYHGRPAISEHEKRQLVETRVKGYAAMYNLYIEPWIPVKGHQTIASVVSELRELHARTIHVTHPKSTPGIAMAFYHGCWHRIMKLEGKVHIRKLRGAWGLARPGYMACDCCFFRTDSKELQPVVAGKTNATVQVFHVCTACLNEGVLARTSRAGYIVKRME